MDAANTERLIFDSPKILRPDGGFYEARSYYTSVRSNCVTWCHTGSKTRRDDHLKSMN